MPDLLARFLVYGALGWCLEIVFTGTAAVLLRRDRAATATTYLWMHPIYGGTALLLERLHAALGGVGFGVRVLAYVLVIYAAEALAGHLLRRALGRCPWDYGRRGVSVAGLVRLDYAPLWAVVAMLFEPAQAVTRGLTAMVA